jgi:hypothetical protein
VERFIARFADQIIGTLSGFDRLVFRGHLRRIIYPAGMTLFLNIRRVRFKDFRQFTLDTTGRLQQVTYDAARAPPPCATSTRPWSTTPSRASPARTSCAFSAASCTATSRAR